jgi:7-cyano-7-deazaguanine synthase
MVARDKPSMKEANSALVLFSGGQDSTTCLAWALQRFQHVETVAFDYRQRHRIELDQRLVVLEEIRRRLPHWSNRLGEDHFVDMGVLGQISDTSLTRDMAFEMEKGGLPNSFVPGRNLLFFTFAAAIAWRRGIRHLVGGMCETDYSGYPDCRDNTLKSLQVTLNLGMDRSFVRHTPLMWLDKAETWALAKELGGDALVETIRIDTHTCYESERGPLHDWGHGCGACPACELRKRGYEMWKAAKA